MIIQIKDLINGKFQIDPLIKKSLVVGTTPNSRLLIKVDNKGCLNCIKKRFLSSSYFSNKKYEFLDEKTAIILNKKIPNNKNIVYELTKTKIITHHILPVPNCNEK